VTTPSDDGCQLWTEVVGSGDGSGRPLVLCHGGPGLWDMFGALALDLAGATGGPVVRWDQRGCGRSQRSGPYSLARSVADLDAVRAHLGVSVVDLLGHSWGAMLALRYALAHPERVGALVYACGTGIDPGAPWRPAFHANAEVRLGIEAVTRLSELRTAPPSPERDREQSVLQWSADFVDPDRAIGHARAMAEPWFGINWDCSAEVNADVRAYLDGIDVAALCRDLWVPTLIVDGERDNRPRWAVDSLHCALPAVRRVTLAEAGHLPWVERPGEFRAAVADFLAGRRTPAGRLDHGGYGEVDGSSRECT
jgi:proline iminopeptidase